MTFVPASWVVVAVISHDGGVDDNRHYYGDGVDDNHGDIMMVAMLKNDLCSGKLGRCCRHLPHGGRWAARQQGRDRDLEYFT